MSTLIRLRTRTYDHGSRIRHRWMSETDAVRLAGEAGEIEGGQEEVVGRWGGVVPRVPVGGHWRRDEWEV